MATLTTEQKLEVYREFMQVAGQFYGDMRDKNYLKSACLAVYDWFVANQTGLVAALQAMLGRLTMDSLYDCLFLFGEYE